MVGAGQWCCKGMSGSIRRQGQREANQRQHIIIDEAIGDKKQKGQQCKIKKGSERHFFRGAALQL